jgi:hypothetical protein
MCKNVVELDEIRNGPNASFTIPMEIGNEMISLLSLILITPVEGKRKTYMPFILFLSTVKNLIFAEERCSYNF